MNNISTNKILWGVFCVVAIGAIAYFVIPNKTAVQPLRIEYRNSTYGFIFALPVGWERYLVTTDNWIGYTNSGDERGDITVTTGSMLIIRNPKWTQPNPYQDIPIMIFTLAQWQDLQQEKFHIGAAPMGPSELGRNAKFVFALPARYNYAFPTGYEEVDQIIQSKPLKTF